MSFLHVQFGLLLIKEVILIIFDITFQTCYMYWW